MFLWTDVIVQDTEITSLKDGIRYAGVQPDVDVSKEQKGETNYNNKL